MTARYRPVVLCVLDGWGIAPDGPGNAVARAHTPRLDAIAERYPRAALDASGRAVGLPDGVMGNSEVGHLTMGAGYVQYQELVRINDAIADGSFVKNAAFRRAIDAVRASGTLHLMGLLSTGGVHADLRHLNALSRLAKGERVRHVVHLFLDGRDMPPRSALELLPAVEAPVATIQGRYWAMAGARAYDAIVGCTPVAGSDPVAYVQQQYDAGVTDEFIEPVHLEGRPGLEPGDTAIFFNFRPDRARQLTWAFMQDDFSGFVRERRPKRLTFVTVTDYKVGLPNVLVAFPSQPVIPLASVLADAGLRQFHTAETEKYAHVTYFFNGGREEPFKGEDRVLVPSPRVATYDLQPEMSASGVADAITKAIASKTYDFAIVNYANPDMVGHTGDIAATERAMAATDDAVGRTVDATLDADGAMILTADHGNAEEMLFPDGSRNTQHSTNPVPVFFIAADAERYKVRDGGLRDIAPTLLDLLGLPVPERMTGKTLLSKA